jgi:hypothetical protein
LPLCDRHIEESLSEDKAKVKSIAKSAFTLLVTAQPHHTQKLCHPEAQPRDLLFVCTTTAAQSHHNVCHPEAQPRDLLFVCTTTAAQSHHRSFHPERSRAWRRSRGTPIATTLLRFTSDDLLRFCNADAVLAHPPLKGKGGHPAKTDVKIVDAMLEFRIMSTAPPSIPRFFRALVTNWFSRMSGAASVVSAFLAFYLPQTWGKGIFASAAIVCLGNASYTVWAAERRSRCVAEELTQTPFATQKLVITNPTLALATGLSLSIANSGQVNFVVTEIETLISDSKPHRYEFNQPVTAGGPAATIGLPSFWSEYNVGIYASLDFQIRTRITWLKYEQWLPPIAFHTPLSYGEGAFHFQNVVNTTAALNSG